jgi:hypothetical protein
VAEEFAITGVTRMNVAPTRAPDTAAITGPRRKSKRGDTFTRLPYIATSLAWVTAL